MDKRVTTLLLLLTCTILSINAIKSIVESYSVATIYQERKRQTEKQYLEVIKKKNELDYINSPFFVEKQLRESLNFYKKGEKLLVFTESPTGTSNATTATTIVPPTQQWITLLQDGILSPLD